MPPAPSDRNPAPRSPLARPATVRLRHRLILPRHKDEPEGRQWGRPTGYANSGESFEDTIVREVREESGLKVRVNELAHLKSGYKL